METNMAIERVSMGRAQINNTGNGLQISIPSKKNWFIIIFLSIWMCGWVIGEIGAITAISTGVVSGKNPGGVGLFLAVWLTGWTFGGAFCIAILGWNLKGMEIISLSNGILKIERKAFNIGQTKEYSLADTANFRISRSVNMWEASTNFGAGMEFWGFGGGIISFDYGMQTVKFANGIDEAEANHIISEMKSYGYIK